MRQSPEVEHTRRLLDKLRHLENKAEQAMRLSALSQVVAWGELAALVREEIEAKKRSLVQHLDPADTARLRAEIHALHWFVSMPEIDERDVMQYQKEIASLRKVVEKRRMMGLADSPPGLEPLADVGRQVSALSEQ